MKLNILESAKLNSFIKQEYFWIKVFLYIVVFALALIFLVFIVFNERKIVGENDEFQMLKILNIDRKTGKLHVLRNDVSDLYFYEYSLKDRILAEGSGSYACFNVHATNYIDSYNDKYSVHKIIGTTKTSNCIGIKK